MCRSETARLLPSAIANEVRSPVIQVGRSTLAAWEWGTRGRPAVLLLHSLAAHSHWWDGVAPLLEGSFHIVAVDFRGHGGSEHMTPPAYHFDDYVADVIAALDVLGWPKPLVVGHS